MKGTTSGSTKQAGDQNAVCEPAEIAGWIGLTDATLLGTEPITLPAATVERLKVYGPRVEFSRQEVAAILHVRMKQVTLYLQADRKIVLGHRRTSAKKPVIGAADLAAFITATVKPPVPTTGMRSRTEDAELQRRLDEGRARHNMPRVPA
jgi:hypothetical protein